MVTIPYHTVVQNVDLWLRKNLTRQRRNYHKGSRQDRARRGEKALGEPYRRQSGEISPEEKPYAITIPVAIEDGPKAAKQRPSASLVHKISDVFHTTRRIRSVEPPSPEHHTKSRSVELEATPKVADDNELPSALTVMLSAYSIPLDDAFRKS
jgi:hypothetical protein